MNCCPSRSEISHDPRDAKDQPSRQLRRGPERELIAPRTGRSPTNVPWSRHDGDWNVEVREPTTCRRWPARRPAERSVARTTHPEIDAPRRFPKREPLSEADPRTRQRSADQRRNHGRPRDPQRSTRGSSASGMPRTDRVQPDEGEALPCDVFAALERSRGVACHAGRALALGHVEPPPQRERVGSRTGCPLGCDGVGSPVRVTHPTSAWRNHADSYTDSAQVRERKRRDVGRPVRPARSSSSRTRRPGIAS